MTENDNDTRLVFRATNTQYERLNKFFMKSGQYQHMSELLRRILEIGLDKLEE